MKESRETTKTRTGKAYDIENVENESMYMFKDRILTRNYTNWPSSNVTKSFAFEIGVSHNNFGEKILWTDKHLTENLSMYEDPNIINC